MPSDTSDVRETLAQATAQLAAARVATARVDAELLLADLLVVPRGHLLLQRDIQAGLRQRYFELIERRQRGVPLQYLTGTAAFRHLDLQVGPGVFIPRPETELLLELAAQPLRSAETVIDLCSGSGAIALSVAHEYPKAQVVAVERSDSALEWLQRNVAARQQAGDRATVVVHADVDATHGDPALTRLCAAFAGRVDVVLANPPYVPSATAVSVEVGFDPTEAVFAGRDGLALMPAVFALAAVLLRPGGTVAVEHDESHAAGVVLIAESSGNWSDIGGHQDLTGRDRFISAVRKDVEL